MEKILVAGYQGKMGSVVFETLKSAGFDVVGKGHGDDFDHIGKVKLVIEFGGAECSACCAKWCKENRVPLVIGSTGHSAEQVGLINDAAKETVVVMAGNFSLGIWCTKQMIKMLKTVGVTEACIFEKHHKNKKDSPSGTALELANVVKNELKINPQLFSLRGGKEIGTHEISFYFEDECIEISHKAFSRTAFAKGVVLVAKNINKLESNGIYSFEDMMGNF